MSIDVILRHVFHLYHPINIKKSIKYIMIKATAIFGKDAVNRYEETNKVPSTR